MSAHTIYTEPAPKAEGILLNVRCSCEQFIGTFDDTMVGRALAVGAKNAHRREVGGRQITGDDVSFPTSIGTVLIEIGTERLRQLEQWGDRGAKHADGTGWPGDREVAEAAILGVRSKNASVTWREILAEETSEAFAATDPAVLRDKLVKAAAVCAAWVQDLDSRAAG